MTRSGIGRVRGMRVRARHTSNEKSNDVVTYFPYTLAIHGLHLLRPEESVQGISLREDVMSLPVPENSVSQRLLHD
ncbi:hypothetical protein H845_729 [Komagataeibacter xylinus E25]|nr:hypothetical protein H845_729 [Komagataeibacter xylinus E25]